jgi:hypothetical protein
MELFNFWLNDRSVMAGKKLAHSKRAFSDGTG